MKIRNILAASAAAVVAASALAVSAAAATQFTALSEGQAILGFGDADWKVAGWGKNETDANAIPLDSFKLATVTGNGTYTVGITIPDNFINAEYVDEDTEEEIPISMANGIGAMGINLNIDSSLEEYADICMNITSVKFDGVECMKADVVSYTNFEDGGFRANVYNPWASFKPESDKTVDADKANNVLVEAPEEWKTVEVTFDVTGWPEADPEDSTPEDSTPEDSTPADSTPADSTPASSTPDKGTPNTGVAGVAAVAGVAVVAAGAIVLSKKRS